MVDPRFIAKRLAAAMPGRANVLPTPMRSGTRVSVTVRGVVGYGTVKGSYSTGSGPGDATAFVELDQGAGRFDIPWVFLGVPDDAH